MNNYQMFRKIQERDNIIKKYSNDTKEDLIDLVIEKDKEIEELKSKIDKAIKYCEYNNEGLYTFEPDYDYEENMVDNYEPSNFREELLDILKENN